MAYSPQERLLRYGTSDYTLIAVAYSQIAYFVSLYLPTICITTLSTTLLKVSLEQNSEVLQVFSMVALINTI